MLDLSYLVSGAGSQDESQTSGLSDSENNGAF